MENNAIEKYASRTELTAQEADQILQRFWPKANPDARWKAALTCHTYGLNPLMGHVALMKFHDRRTDKDEWVVALDIKAKRILARRQGDWSYLDFSPRAATEEEVKQIFGNDDMKGRTISLTHIKDDAGREAWGVGVVRDDEVIHGENKGNTRRNMANIRSESQALFRKFPDAIPVSAVFDATFEDVTDEDAGPFPEMPEAQDLAMAGTTRPAEADDIIQTPGQFMTYCYEKYGLSPSKVLAELNIESAEQIKNFSLAKQTIDNVYG